MLKTLYSIIRNKYNHIKTMATLKNSYKVVEILGQGKDGRIYLCRNKDNMNVVVKVLSVFGQGYLDITKEFIKRNVNSEHLYRLKIFSDKFIIYPYEKLNHTKTDPKYFIKYLTQICDLEMDLIKKNICYWDFGFVDHCNYMENNYGKIKLIDYGGNSFLLINEKNSLNTREQRKNLIYAKNNFLKLQFILHIYYYGLGRRTTTLLSTTAQNSSDDELNKLIDFVQKEMNDTIYTDIIRRATAPETDLLTEAGWKVLKQEIEKLLKHSNLELPQESAHIDTIKFPKENEVQVRGYQNYNIADNQITPLSIDAKPLWNTEPKFRLVDKALNQIADIKKIDSFLDIGSNLGLYVFLSKLKYQFTKCYGIDYNKKYIETCKIIIDTLGIEGCTFSYKKFSDINNSYDCVLAMGIIHHLFHRTEDFGSLKTIMESFSKITKKFLIIEFPSEKDVKAKKWTNILGRAKTEEYNYTNFIHFSKLYFSDIEKIGSVNKTRTIYILKK